MANYTIISAWLDGETIRYKLNNNSTWAAFNGRNIENVSNTATTISFAQGEFIKVMSLNATSGGVSSPRTIGQRKIQRQQPETPSFQQQYDKRGSRNNSNDREINDRYGDDSEDNGTSGSIASWLARRWWIAFIKLVKYGFTSGGFDVPDLFFLLLPFIPFIILYYLISGIYGTAVNAVDSAADKFSSENDKPVQTSVVTESSGNPAGELPWRLPQTSETTESSENGSNAQSSAVADSAVKNNYFQETTYSEHGRIKGTNVNMREYPNLEGRVIYRFPGQEDVLIHEVTNLDQGKYPWFKVSYKNLTGWVYGQFVINQSDVKKAPKDTVTAGNQADISTPSEIAPQKAENKIQLTGEKVMFPYERHKSAYIPVIFYDNERPQDKRYGNKAMIYPGEYVYTTNETKTITYLCYLAKHETLGFVWINENPNKWKNYTHEPYRLTFELPDVEVYKERKFLKENISCRTYGLDRVGIRSSIAAGDYVLMTSKNEIVWHDRLGFVRIAPNTWEELAGSR